MSQNAAGCRKRGSEAPAPLGVGSVTVFKHARERGGTLVLCAPSEKVPEVLDLSGLSPIFTLYDDQVSAIGSF
nr:STAS domain-containing protein [Anaerolineae bacterium]